MGGRFKWTLKLRECCSRKWETRFNQLRSRLILLQITFQNTENQNILAPIQAIQRLIDAGKLFRSSTDPDVLVMDAPYKMIFKEGKVEITHPSLLNQTSLNSSYIVSKLRVNDLIEYRESPTWILSNDIFRYACVFFDYGRLKVGLGNMELNPPVKDS
jgi:hypothetical protein